MTTVQITRHEKQRGQGGQSQLGLGPLAWLRSAWRNRVLITRLARREIEARYRGSFLGIFWSLFVPIMLLGVYTFVFSVIFQARWDSTVTDKKLFALILFTGLIIFNIFAECINRAPGLLLANVTYIKKVVFPLEILPWVALVAALFNAFVSFGVLAACYLVFIGLPSWTVALIPLMLIPHMLMTLGLTLFLASTGVFLRDLQQVIGVLTTILMFLTPLFYPLSAIPEGFRRVVQSSPLALEVEGARNALFWGQTPSIDAWLIFFVASWLVAWMGYVWFMKTKKGFADVV